MSKKKNLSKAQMKAERAKQQSRRRMLWLILPLAVLAVAAALYLWLPREERLTLQVGNSVFTVEVARSQEERNRGLSNRESLAPDGGMLFVFGQPTRPNFWMKDTTVPLSLAYLDATGTVVELHDLEPLSESLVIPKELIRFALELPQGAFQRAGVRMGDRIRIVSTTSSIPPPF